MSHALRLMAPALALLFTLSASAAAPVATVIDVTGEAWLATTDGTRVALAADATIGAGAHVVTGDGRVRFEFTDGGIVSVQPATTFRVERYAYAGAEDGDEWALFELVRGGLRVMSGAIGHARPERYRLRTVFATIGIRGTAYNVLACDEACALADGSRHPAGLHVETTEGTIFVENPAGLLDVPVGRAAYVPNAATAPVFTQFSPGFVALPPPVAEERVAGDEGAEARAEAKSAADAVTTTESPKTSSKPGLRIATAIGARDATSGAATKRAVITGSDLDFQSRIAQVNAMLNESFGRAGTTPAGPAAGVGEDARQRVEALERTAATSGRAATGMGGTIATPRAGTPLARTAAVAKRAPVTANTAIARAAVVSRVTATVAQSAVANTRINAAAVAASNAAGAKAALGP